MPTVLIVEDESSIAQSLEFVLQAEGFETLWHSLAGKGIEAVREGEADFVVLDVGLPDMSGFEACKEIRTFSDIPILFLTARGDEIDRIVGLEIGGDDYVVKPFSPREVASRVKVILRRLKKETSSLATHSQPGFYVDQEAYQIQYESKALDLTKAEYLLLSSLLQKPRQVFSRGQLLEAMACPNQETYERAVDSHVKTLRAKLRAVGAPDNTIATVRGFGYRFEG